MHAVRGGSRCRCGGHREAPERSPERDGPQGRERRGRISPARVGHQHGEGAGADCRGGTHGESARRQTPGHSLYGANLREPHAIVLGGEARGLRRLTREKCDRIVSIPLRDSVQSLNVSAAAAVFLFEAIRQRSAGPRADDAGVRDAVT